jgi:uncharacterized Zn-binding protein involved in type VI secretion
MTAGICRIGDQITGTCEANAPGHPRQFVGTWKTGSSNILIDGIGAIRNGDTGLTDCNHHIFANGGSSTYSANGVPIMCVGDTVGIVEGGFGVTTTGSTGSTCG